MKTKIQILTALALMLPLAGARAVTFSNAIYTVESGPGLPAVADINGDGRLDLICPNFGFRNNEPGTPGGWNNTMTVLTNNGSGGFGSNATLVVGTGPAAPVAVDLDGDGKPDVVSANNTDNTLTVLTNNGGGRFGFKATLPVGRMPNCVIAMDSLRLGRLDLVCANNGTNTLTVLTNDGTGAFGFTTNLTVGNGPYTIVALDANADGWPDMACANFTDNTASVLTNNGTGGFATAATYSVGLKPDCIAAGDFNNDGKPDLVTVNWGGNTMTVLTNNGRGAFASSATIPGPANTATPSSVAVADVNGDGYLDLVRANTGDGGSQWTDTLSVFTNNGRGSFSFAATLHTGGRVPNVVSADLNADGKPDLACPNYVDGTLTVLLNTTMFVRTLVSTFDSDADGWTGIDVQGPPYDVVARGPYALNWLATGGNPGGRVGTTDTDGTLFCFSAPAKFLGNRLGWYRGSLSYQLRFQNNGLAPGNAHPDVILIGAGLTLLAKAGIDPANQADTWLPFGVTFNESAWHLANLAGQNPTAGQLQAVLANLTAVYFRGDYFAGLDTAWLDNVVAAPPALQIQSPSLAGGNFTFSVATVNGLSYTVQQNTNLTSANWSFCTNWIGNGTLQPVTLPAVVTPEIFYRVQTP